MTERSETEFRRDRLTWVAYVMLACFAYLQAAPGLVIVHLRDELGLSYSTGGLHVAAFAAGSLVAGLVSARLERALGRRALFWSAAAVLGAGAAGLAAGRVAGVTVASVQEQRDHQRRQQRSPHPTPGVVVAEPTTTSQSTRRPRRGD
jgi:MFS family permease